MDSVGPLDTPARIGPAGPALQGRLHGRAHVRTHPSWMTAPALDAFMAQVVNDLQHVARGGGDLPTKFCVPNTESSGSRGFHWFAVVYSVRRAPEAPLTDEMLSDLIDTAVDAAR